MYVTEQYYLYQLADHLMINEDFQLLHMNTQTDEVWLEKQNRQVSTVIRLVHKGYDWKNHLKTDIATVFQRVTMMMRLLKGKQIEVFNVYITEHEPVDDWETLKKTMVLKERKPVRMNVFYLSESNYKTEQTRLCEKMAVKEPKAEPNNINQETTIQDYKQKFQYIIEKKYHDIHNVLTFGKPRLVYILMAIHIFIYIFLEVAGSTSISGLLSNSAGSNPFIMEDFLGGLTSVFLHVSWLHLCVQLFALYLLGSLTERIFGSFRFVVIYFLTGVGAGLAGNIFYAHIFAGASGALFGLLGALFYIGYMYRNVFKRTIQKPIFLIFLINLIIALLLPDINMIAPIFGFIFGLLTAVSTSLPKKKFHFYQLFAMGGYLLLFVVMYLYG